MEAVSIASTGGMLGSSFVSNALSPYLSNRIWPGIWPGEHMWDWLLRLLLHWQVCVLSGGGAVQLWVIQVSLSHLSHPVDWAATTCTWTREAALQTLCWKAAACTSPWPTG